VTSEPSGHRDRGENPSKNRLAVLGTAYIGVLSDERGQPSGRFNREMLNLESIEDSRPAGTERTTRGPMRFW
jgi:hypothetical protein